jgi:hypothetical protein
MKMGRRLHLIELGDQPWCPQAVRNGITDHLQLIEGLTRVYARAASKLADALRETAATRVLDLGSGSGGPWGYLLPALQQRGATVEVCLSDKHPNLIALERARRLRPGAITIHHEPVDAANVQDDIQAFRTLFTVFHHFPPEQARVVLADAAAKRQGIGIFEAMEASPLMLFMLAFVPLVVLLVTPFTRPFRWSRLLWTYLVPALPLAILFDGIVSALRTYGVEELRALSAGVGVEGYRWEAGRIGSRWSPGAVVYLIGIPSVTSSR